MFEREEEEEEEEGVMTNKKRGESNQSREGGRGKENRREMGKQKGKL